ncbi:hypothetical protein CQ012_04465 [Arthrobacter sp. MYb214]|nr:hypothetical protein CQ016_04165 [Arthrobacter sp. MYb222]PRB78621.1 hypothetical protein CQ012_04465 [Arthrobacter sp. MYb214]
MAKGAGPILVRHPSLSRKLVLFTRFIPLGVLSATGMHAAGNRTESSIIQCRFHAPAVGWILRRP